mmetsp:Transcript_49528/g.78424  ORF Transcript_49528/g.78424 Transcript_49528/m.78424 type:complete len:81 (-) Transcript_49528:7-249(-)
MSRRAAESKALSLTASTTGSNFDTARRKLSDAGRSQALTSSSSKGTCQCAQSWFVEVASRISQWNCIPLAQPCYHATKVS